ALDPTLQLMTDRVRISVVEAGLDIVHLFSKLDTTGCGFLRQEEISMMALAYDEGLTGYQLENLFRHFDPRGSGNVDLEGFRRGLGFLASSENQGPLDKAVLAQIAQATQSLHAR
ncbi:unnamed protein product, partial [Polarella glacialis]